MSLAELLDMALEMEKGERPEVLGKVVPIYEHDFSKYPDRLRVSFADGRTFVYDIHTDQPAPVIIENVRIIRNWKQGYVNRPQRRKRK